MEKASVLLMCILVTCSVHGRTLQLSIDDEEQAEISVDSQGLPGTCKACMWTVNKVKEFTERNTTVESLTDKLSAVCNQMGHREALCRKLVKSNLKILIEELITMADVRTICVNIKACKPKESLDVFFDQNNEESRPKISVFY